MSEKIENIIHININNILKTYIINLNERTDRLKIIINNLEQSKVTNYERFSAIKPTIDFCLKYPLINYRHLWSANKKFLNPKLLNDCKYIIGATGCKISHLQIMEHFLQNDKEEYLLILEDDCIIPEDLLFHINNKINIIKQNNINFNILYLSVNIAENNLDKSFTILNEHLIKLNNNFGLTTHGMIFNRNTIINAINKVKSSKTEIDNAYTQLENRLCCIPMISYQSSGISNIGSHQYNNNEVNYSRFDIKFNEYFNKKFNI